jgi:hypothetical protein
MFRKLFDIFKRKIDNHEKGLKTPYSYIPFVGNSQFYSEFFKNGPLPFARTKRDRWKDGYYVRKEP